MVTLTAVILAVGMVVDASVVVLENITRHYQEEKLSPMEAALVGAVEIQFAVIAGNAPTLTVLIPLLFLSGFVGKTFGPLAATLSIAFVSSLLVALSLVPILTMQVTKDGSKTERFAAKIARPWNKLMDMIRNGYVGVLRISLRKRWLVFATATALFVLGLILLRFQGWNYSPKWTAGPVSSL